MKLSRTFLLLFLVSITVHAQKILSPGQVEIEALRGLDSVRVVVKSEVKNLDEEFIRRSVEKRLKSENVPISNSDTSSYLVLTLSSLGDVVVIHLALQRFASMDCKESAFLVPMWQRERLSLLSKGRVPFDVSYVVDLFGSDYNSINRR